ncbi:MAG: Vgb family protein [Microthrixaceae bacterium]
MKICRILAGVAAVLAGVAAPASGAGERSVGDSRVFASVPTPGQPAGIAVDCGRVLVTTLGLPPEVTTDPKLFAFDASGKLDHAVTIPRMMPASAMALFGVAADGQGRAYVVDMHGRIVRVDPVTGAQTVYAEFPAAVGGVTTMPVDLAFDDAGAAYVTDQNLAAIWRVPAGGGVPTLWFQDPRLAGYINGPTGIRLHPTDGHLYFTVAISAYGPTAGAGLVYRVPATDDPSAGQLEEVFRYPVRSSPFGLAFGASGKLYVALYGPHQLSILRPGTGVTRVEELRFPSTEDNAARPVPFDRPVSVAFDGQGSLLVTNSASASAPNPKRMVVFDVFVDDTAGTMQRPVFGTDPPAGCPLSNAPGSSQRAVSPKAIAITPARGPYARPSASRQRTVSTPVMPPMSTGPSGNVAGQTEQRIAPPVSGGGRTSASLDGTDSRGLTIAAIGSLAGLGLVAWRRRGGLVKTP